MRKAIGACVLGFLSCGSYAQSPAQQDCNLLSSTVAATADWRDNGVPLAKAQANVERVLNQMPATAADKKNWRDTVTAIYGSSVPSDQIETKLRSLCR